MCVEKTKLRILLENKCLWDTNTLDLSVENFTHGKSKAFNFIRGTELITLISQYTSLDVAFYLFFFSK